MDEFQEFADDVEEFVEEVLEVLEVDITDPSYTDPTFEDPSVDDPTQAPDEWNIPTPGQDIADLPQFDPSTATPLSGDPGGAMDVWHEQQAMDTCAVVSQEFVLEELTGQEFDEAELAAEAEQNGWYEPGGGTPLEHMDKLLDSHGVPTEMTSADGISDIQEALDGGNKVIVALDSSEIWEPGMDEMMDEGTDTIPGQGADHAVEVTGIVDTPDGQMVVLNDPGSPEGQGCMIPVEEFENAWADSDNHMVEAGYNLAAA